MIRLLRLVAILAVALFGLAAPAAAEEEPVLRTGDVLFVALPGEPSLNRDFTVDRAGLVQLPEVGPKRIAGLPLSQARTLIRDALALTIRDPSRLEITLRERRLPITVGGFVKSPGTVELAADAGVQAAFAAAGGLLTGAQLDRVQLRRGETVIVFDYRRYLDDGNEASLPKLEPLDMLFVPATPLAGSVMAEFDPKAPPTGPAARPVQVVGSVKMPGIFPTPDDATLFEVLGLAGGPLPTADLTGVRVLKKKDGGTEAIHVDLDGFIRRGGAVGTLPRPEKGDVIFVPERPTVAPDPRTLWTKLRPEASIYVMGQVVAAGRYAFDPNLGFLDIISVAGGPTLQADLRNVRVSHRGVEGAQTTTVNFQRYLETGDERLLPKVRPGDVVFFPERTKDLTDEASAGSTVRVLGAVGRPGRYPFADRMTILDLLAEAGGPTNEAMQDRVVVVNFTGGREEARLFDLPAFAKTGDIRRVPVVRAGDLVYVPNKGQSEWRGFTETLSGLLQGVTLVALLSRL